jgi:hypothetical protein
VHGVDIDATDIVVELEPSGQRPAHGLDR